MKLALVALAVTLCLFGSARAEDNNIFIDSAKDVGPDIVNGMVRGKIEDRLRQLTDHAQSTEIAYRDKKMPAECGTAPGGNDPTYDQIDGWIASCDHIIRGLREVDLVEHSQRRKEFEQLAALSDTTGPMFDKVAKSLLPVAPTEAYSYFQMSLVDADDFSYAANSALSTIRSYEKSLTEHIEQQEKKLENTKSWVSGPRDPAKKCGTILKPLPCRKKSTGGGGGFSAGGGGGVVQ